MGSAKESTLIRFKTEIVKLKKEVGALYLACKRKDVSIYVKIAAALVVGYALSPIDLIPDFIPVLGYLDDMILLPLGIWLVVKMIPKPIMEACRKQAEEIFTSKKPVSYIAGSVIILIWIGLLAAIAARVVY